MKTEKIFHATSKCEGCDFCGDASFQHPIVLKFRCKLPDGRYFEQGDQFINSFMRRAVGFIKWGGDFDKDVSDCHESYLEKPLEDYLEILIDGKWRQCTFELK